MSLLLSEQCVTEERAPAPLRQNRGDFELPLERCIQGKGISRDLDRLPKQERVRENGRNEGGSLG